MDELTKELLDALQALVDAAWLEDSHAVRFDGTVMFSPGYDFSGIDGRRRAEFRDEGIEFVVWPAGGAGRNWSAYSTYDGSLWFELFETEDEAREQCMKLLDQVMPDHPVSKARAAIAKAEAILAATQSDDGWIPWTGGDCPVEVGTRVDAKYRDGEKAYNVPAGYFAEDPNSGSALDWSHMKNDYDIIAYRVVNP